MSKIETIMYLQGLYRVLLLEECAKLYPAGRMGFGRDYSRLLSYSKARGLRFFTLDLPAYGKVFDNALSVGHFPKTDLRACGGRVKGRAIPKLFSVLLDRVFGVNDSLLSDVDAQAIFLIRTLCFSGKKWKVECAKSKTYNEVADFYSTDTSLRFPDLKWGDLELDLGGSHSLHLADGSYQGHRDNPTLRLYGTVVPDLRGRPDPSFWDLNESTGEFSIKRRVGDVLFTTQRVSDVWCSTVGLFAPQFFQPQHGPGAVSDIRTGSRSKFDFPHWPEKLERVFDQSTYGFHSYAAWAEFAAEIGQQGFSPLEVPSKLIDVPKTQKGPRLIAAEPTANQWCQQIIRKYLMNSVSHSWLKYSIDFHDQTKNQNAALEASEDGLKSTMDLSSASDRLSCWVAERVFRGNPSLLEALNATRTGYISNSIDKKSPRYYKLRKLSTMGSAVTFPIQSIVFALIAIGTIASILNDVKRAVKHDHYDDIARDLGYVEGVLDRDGFAVYAENSTLLSDSQEYERTSDSRGELSALARMVRVFGDDIIVPVYAQDRLKLVLEYLGFKVNDAKTFGTGKFRESCGVDAYDGVDVTPPYVLREPVQSRPESIVSVLKTVQNFHKRKLHIAAEYLTETVRRRAPKLVLPTVAVDSGVFGWPSLMGFELHNLKRKWDEKLQQWRYQVHQVTTKVKRGSSRPNSRFLQYFTDAPEPDRWGVIPVWQSGHVERTRVYIRPAWVLVDDMAANLLPEVD